MIVGLDLEQMMQAHDRHRRTDRAHGGGLSLGRSGADYEMIPVLRTATPNKSGSRHENNSRTRAARSPKRTTFLSMRGGWAAAAFASLFVILPGAAWARAKGAITVERHDEPEPDRAAGEAELSVLGRVAYADADVEIPIAPHAALVPAAELWYLAPVSSDPHQELHPLLGAGLALDGLGGWDWELSILHGPRAYGLTVSDVALDASRVLDTGLEIDATLGARQLGWNPPASIGSDVAQLYLDAAVRVRLSDGLKLRPRAMLFLYDRSLAPQTTDDVDTLSALALVGSYAPRALAGARLTWTARPALAPVAEIDGIAYAGGVGFAGELVAGAWFAFGPDAHATITAGVLHNWLRGVAGDLDDQRTVPVVQARVTVGY
jgi:hypothetical protein